ncbi:hypothetical protein D3C77_693190 [compost metagenome]
MLLHQGPCSLVILLFLASPGLLFEYLQAIMVRRAQRLETLRESFAQVALPEGALDKSVQHGNRGTGTQDFKLRMAQVGHGHIGE